MEPLGDLGHSKSRFGPFGNGVSVSVRLVHGLRQMNHRLSNHFGRTRWYSKVMRLKWKLISVGLESANLRRTYHRLSNHFGCTLWNS
jgi:hypothetical protein